MSLVRCENGHYYDEARYPSCPHCAALVKRDDDLTVPMIRTDVHDALTEALDSSAPSGRGSLREAVKAAIAGEDVPAAEEKTVGFYKELMDVDPVVGWLVCTKGEHYGEDFKLKSGRNFIGRSAGMDVAILKDPSVSRERHAVVMYEPRGNQFIVQAGDSKELSYLNGKVVLTPETIKAHDRLLVGKTELMFIPCCTDSFSWQATNEKNS